MFYVYILANKPHGTLYIGYTGDLSLRMIQHKRKYNKGFSNRYNLDKLVWNERHETKAAAFARERQMKEWNRSWKIKRIEALNPEWEDLSFALRGGHNTAGFDLRCKSSRPSVG
jgi:putative endonuclease